MYQTSSSPTTSLSIPNFARLVWRLRNDAIARSVTILHATREGEGEWVLSIAAARMARRGAKTVGPEPWTVFDTVEYGVRIGADVIFTGELRRVDDARALRAAASYGARAVGIITAKRFSEAQMLLEALGPWIACDVALFSIAAGTQA